jgi:hypothetical protein
MMNRLIIRVVFLLLGAALITIMLFRNRTPFGRNNSSFAAVPAKEITGIELTQGKKRLVLTKKEGQWLINGKSEARKNGVLFFLRVIQEMKIKSPVSPDLFRKEVKDNKIEPVKVKVYEKGRLIKSILVYKTQSNIYGNIMKVREGAKPFIVYLPGFEGNIGSGFTLNEMFWQPYTIFNLMPSEIVSVDFENFADTASSFFINARNGHYVVSGGNRVIGDTDSVLVRRYLSYFTWIPFEKWAFDLSENERHEIESGKPLYRITVSTVSGNKNILTLTGKMTGEDGKKVADTDRLYGRTQASDEIFIIRYFDIDPLLKKRSYFSRE